VIADPGTLALFAVASAVLTAAPGPAVVYIVTLSASSASVALRRSRRFARARRTYQARSTSL